MIEHLGKYKFGVRGVLSTQELVSGGRNVAERYCEKLGVKMGVEIARNKEFTITDTDHFNSVEYSLNLYVLTPYEMEEYIQLRRREWEKEFYDTVQKIKDTKHEKE